MFGSNKKKNKTAQAKPQRRMDDPAYSQKAAFWDRKLWRQKNPNKGNRPIAGALMVIGKDSHNRDLLVPTIAPHHRLLAIPIQAKEANDITVDHMKDVLQRLDEYTIRK